MSDDDDFCQEFEDRFILKEATPELRLATIVAAGISGVVSLLSFAYFMNNKNKYLMLQKRNAILTFFMLLSFIVIVIGSTRRVLTGANTFSCRELVIYFSVQFVLFLEASAARLFSLFWRITYNKSLIKETYAAMAGGKHTIAVGDESFVKKTEGSSGTKSYYAPVFQERQEPIEEEVKVTGLKSLPYRIRDGIFSLGVVISPCLFYIVRWKPPEDLPRKLQFLQFLSSKYAAVLLFIFLASAALTGAITEITQSLPPGKDCQGCPIEAAFEVAPTTLIIIAIVVYFYTLYRLRKVPDSLGIKQELIVVGTLYTGLVVFAVGFLRALFPQVEEDGRFDYTLLGFAVGIIIVVYMGPCQVWIAKRKAKQTIDVDETLKGILESVEGKKAFALYLTSNLSLETLLFYEAARKWKAQYNTMQPVEQTESARAIFDQYIGHDAFMLINISATCRNEITEAVEQEVVTDSIFDRASAEMFALMSTDIFPRFVKSSYFKAYTNEYQHRV